MAYTTTIADITVEHRTFQATLYCDGVGGQWQEIQFQRMRNYFDASGKLIDRSIDPNPIILRGCLKSRSWSNFMPIASP